MGSIIYSIILRAVNMKKHSLIQSALSLVLVLISLSVSATDVIVDKSIGMELARDITTETIMAWTDSGVFKKARADIQQELNHIEGLIVMEGGLKIIAGGYNIGAVGVSGAPGGDKDAACARKALEKLAERIEFAIDD